MVWTASDHRSVIDGSAPRVYRDRKSWLFIAVGVYGGVLLVAILALAQPGAVDTAKAGVGLVLCLWSILRLSRCGVYATADGIRVVNPLSTSHLRWDEIRRFVLAGRGPSRVERIDGTALKVFALQHSTWAAMRRSTRTPEAAMIDDLNARLQAATGR